jgi:phage protein D
MDAYVVETQVRFGAQPGQSFLDVVALDPSVLLTLEETVRPWPDMADSDIARTLFSDHGFRAEVVDTERTPDAEEAITMQRGTDLALLRALAERNGYEVAVESDPEGGDPVGWFGPPRVDEPEQGVFQVAFGQQTNVDQFEARFDMLRPTEAVARGIESGEGDSDPLASGNPDREEIGGTSLLGSDRPRRVLLAGSGLSHPGDLQALAQATVDRSTWALVAEGRLTTAAYGGLLRPRRPVMVRGAGRTYSGKYYVERVLHSISGDRYEQRFPLRRNALGLSGGEDFTDDGALAPLPLS